MNNKSIKKDKQLFSCEYCDYNTSIKCNYERHILTPKHKKNKYNNKTKNYIYGCECGKKYKYQSGLSSHKHKCKLVKIKNVPEENNKNETTNLEEIFKNMIEKNNDFKNIIIQQQSENHELRKSIQELANKYSNNVTNNITQNNFNLQIFLNEQCRDAINISEFIDSLKIQLEDIDYLKLNGINNSISKIFINGLNELGIYKRPIHCSDIKRETIYIKDNDIWNKDDKKIKLEETYKTLQKKHIDTIKDWEESNPNWQNYSNKKDEYIEIVQNVMTSIDNNKMTKQITKNTIIKK
tara:strand:- start:359 stop:1243 length:885 start_codon:yes stop_codon:yes gene_type:complete